MRDIHHRLYFKIKKAVTVGAIVIGLMSAGITAHASAEGYWRHDETGWWVQFQDGTCARQMWLSDGEKWYAFDDTGYMIIGWWWIDGNWYYFDADGGMHTGWLCDADGTWYLLDSSGVMKTGWQEVSGVWYYMYSNGAMAVNSWVDGCYLDASGAWKKDMVQQQDFTSGITDTINGLRTKYPNNMYWNHIGLDESADYSSTITSTPCNHALNGLMYCNSYILGNVRGYQCDGFARKLSDEVFGVEAGRTEYAYSFDKVKVGDYLRYSTTKDSFVADGHTVFVIGKTKDSLITTEANYGGNCMIHWDGVLSKEYLDSIYAECITRY